MPGHWSFLSLMPLSLFFDFFMHTKNCESYQERDTRGGWGKAMLCSKKRIMGTEEDRDYIAQ